ncbi:hypothetical protein SLS58_002202 [Diplodia intermedia]|uniref:histidine kinase n=1 Tax=Diplodia intermedia TaxID=856260 RepID=A0ABR3U0B7_9PEZI
MPSSRSSKASPRQPPSLDAERARVKKLASYFGSLGIVPEDSSATPACDPVSTSPAVARDATLTALAQLGPLRLQCDRAFVSLTDRSHQYIIAEATRSLSYFDLARHSNDPLYLGVAALDAAWSPDTIHVFTDPAGRSDICTPNVQADRSRYRMCDFRADPHYATRSYVAAWPYARAYLEVPLRTSTGEVIGSYCVVDNRIRDDWADDFAVHVLAEIAQTIMDHIELVKMQEQHHRLERLLNKLCVYVEENTSMQAFETNHNADQSSSASTPRDSPEPSPMSGPVTSRNDSRDKSASTSDDSLETQLTTPSPTPRLNPFESSDFAPDRPTHMLSQNSSSSSDRPPPAQRSRDIPATFSRAANLIQEATDIEGIVFLDASPNGFGTRLDAKSGNASNNVATAHSPISTTEDSPRVKMCETLGKSVSGDSNSSEDSLSIPEPLLQRLLQTHRRGTSFFADALDELDEQEGSDAKSLFQIFSSARSILFMPLWDYQKEGWYAAAIGWSTKANRIFASEDLVYISAFGNSIMNEVSRIEAMSVSHAKSNFISSISHELRSPLHGILASTELLKQTDLDPERMALADMVEVCGVTLLETMDHLLDFAKINHLYRKGRRTSSDGLGGSRGGSRNRKDYLNLCKTTDLGLLVQEVVEGAYLGHSAQAGAQFDAGSTPLDNEDSPASKLDGVRPHKSKPVLLTMSIEKRDDWRLHTEPGAWRRIVLNLVGNALKYTDRGSVEVSLKCVGAENGPNSTPTEDGAEKRYMCLSIKDTGRGISEEYLKYRLFTPYAQEDPLVSGTGLGLSIVHHLVTHFDGMVDIHSEVGVGTCVMVMIPIPNDADGNTPKPECAPDSSEEATETLRGKTVLALAGDLSPHPDTEGEKLLSNALDTAQSWWDMSISQSDTEGANMAADFCMLHAAQLEAAHEKGALRDVTGAIIVICTRQPTKKQLLIAGIYNATFLQQPFGPKKMKNSFKAALSRYNQDSLPPDQLQRRTSWIGTQGRLSNRDSGAGALAIGAPVTATSTQPSSPCPSSPEPASPPPQPTASAVQTPVGEDDRTDRPLHLLLVEDNDINLKILTTYARRLGCTFATATNGHEAVEVFKSATHPPFDVVLMDVSMPVMNGFEATRAIRAWERGQRGVGGGRREANGNGGGAGDAPRGRGRGRKRMGARILALTGLGAAESQREAFSSGMDEFLMKPVPLKRLKGVLFGDDGRGRSEEVKEKEEKLQAMKG